ncbi:MAG: hypothetical protein ABUK01_04360 [Leptospirales bacterium]
MNITNYITIDTKNIFRDPMLTAFVTIVPLLFAVTIFWALPFGIQTFDWLTPWRPQVVTFLVMQSGLLAGAVTTFIILEEKDARNMQALFVTPLQPEKYLIFRIGLPMIYTLVISTVMLWLADLHFTILQILASATLNTMMVPLFALSITSIATNKVEGLTWFKGLNLIAFSPVASFFIESDWSKLFSIIPTYWIYQFNAMLGSDVTTASSVHWVNQPIAIFSIGFIYLVLVNLLLLKTFAKQNMR